MRCSNGIERRTRERKREKEISFLQWKLGNNSNNISQRTEESWYFLREGNDVCWGAAILAALSSGGTKAALARFVLVVVVRQTSGKLLASAVTVNDICSRGRTWTSQDLPPRPPSTMAKDSRQLMVKSPRPEWPQSDRLFHFLTLPKVFLPYWRCAKWAKSWFNSSIRSKTPRSAYKCNFFDQSVLEWCFNCVIIIYNDRPFSKRNSQQIDRFVASFLYKLSFTQTSKYLKNIKKVKSTPFKEGRIIIYIFTETLKSTNLEI